MPRSTFFSRGLILALGLALLLLGCGSLSGGATPTATVVIPTPAETPTLTPTPAASPVSPTALAPVVVPTETATPAASGDATRGQALFGKLPCSSCHDATKPWPGGLICPNLGNIATEADRIVKSADYHGQAQDAAGYIRESILNPNAYIVPGDPYHRADGQSVMPKDFGQTLSPAQIDDLVAYLMTLR